MKKLIATLAAGVFAIIGTSSQADANPYGYGGGYERGGYDRGYDRGHDRGHQRGGYREHRRAPSNHVFISSYSHGRPIFTEQYFVGWDRFGRPVFAQRIVRQPSGYCHTRAHHYAPPRHYSGSGVSVSFGF